MQKLEDTSTPLAVLIAILAYSLCSSTLLLANKMAIEYLPFPSVVSFLQIVFAAVVVLFLKFFCVEIDGFDREKLKAYAMYIVAFVAAIYANMQALKHSNVETVIVFRACSPIAVSILEYLFMGRALPSGRSALSLGLVAFGAILYCFSDSEFMLNGIRAYTWVIIYFFLITFEMTYGKKLTSSVKMESVWGPVLYCNFLAAAPMFLLGYGNGDYENIAESLSEMPANGMAILIFSCIAGTLIGYTGWLCRGMISATSYTLVGVVNKFLTVLLNVIIWDKHSSPMGLVAVCLCLGSGIFYQQSPMREEKSKPMSIKADIELALDREEKLQRVNISEDRQKLLHNSK
jgi:GDP-mannose transporter